MKCKDCACYKNEWCSMVTDSQDPDMERDCGHFIRSQRWISVEEQNPEKHGTYLVWDGKEMNTAKWFCVDVPSHGIKAGWSESIPEGGTYPPFPWRVTHWMPLPEPPEVSDH